MNRTDSHWNLKLDRFPCLVWFGSRFYPRTMLIPILKYVLCGLHLKQGSAVDNYRGNVVFYPICPVRSQRIRTHSIRGEFAAVDIQNGLSHCLVGYDPFLISSRELVIVFRFLASAKGLEQKYVGRRGRWKFLLSYQVLLACRVLILAYKDRSDLRDRFIVFHPLAKRRIIYHEIAVRGCKSFEVHIFRHETE